MRNSAQTFHPKGLELEVSMALTPPRHHELAETLRLRTRSYLPLLESSYNK